jgi:hypothetical protein
VADDPAEHRQRGAQRVDALRLERDPPSPA